MGVAPISSNFMGVLHRGLLSVPDGYDRPSFVRHKRIVDMYWARLIRVVQCLKTMLSAGLSLDSDIR
jgi:hypothetical protein